MYSQRHYNAAVWSHPFQLDWGSILQMFISWILIRWLNESPVYFTLICFVWPPHALNHYHGDAYIYLTGFLSIWLATSAWPYNTRAWCGEFLVRIDLQYYCFCLRIYIDGLVQERCNSSALAMELHLSGTNLSICGQNLVNITPLQSLSGTALKNID